MKEFMFIKEYLSKNLTSKRYQHSINVAETATALALKYHGNVEKAYIAGLVHDCTRELDMDKQQALLRKLNIQMDEHTYQSKELIHAHTAEYIIKNEFKIYDEELLSAVKAHTTGKAAMTVLEKIIFLADVIEPSRSFQGVADIRSLSRSDMNQALILALDSSIKFLIEKKSLIHPDTFLARNDLLFHTQE
jgi:predicted HD superfamily hydrolase involved in NAD metabolism